jgi:uncharacterized protein (DUF4415 family)
MKAALAIGALAALAIASQAHAMADAQATKAKAKPKAAVAASPAQAGRPALKTRPVGDKAIIRTEADAMGFIRGMGQGETTTTINRVQLRGAGKVTVNGVTAVVPHYIYTLSLHLKAGREDFQAPGKARVVRVVLDKDAWDEKEPGIDGRPTSDSALSRRLQLARTPFGFTRALIDADPATVKVTDPGPGGRVTVSFPIEGVATTATLDADYRPATIAMTVEGKAIVTRYSAYRDLSEYGLMFPTVWTETVDGKPSLDLKIDDGRVASYAAFPKPASLASK